MRAYLSVANGKKTNANSARRQDTIFVSATYGQIVTCLLSGRYQSKS